MNEGPSSDALSMEGATEITLYLSIDVYLVSILQKDLPDAYRGVRFHQITLWSVLFHRAAEFRQARANESTYDIVFLLGHRHHPHL
jgi:hypothetical protein